MMHRSILVRSVAIGLVFALLLLAWPAAAGGPGAVFAGSTTISIVTDGHGKKGTQTVPAAYGPNGYKLLASRDGTVIQLNCELLGDMSKRPADLQLEYRVIPGKGVTAKQLNKDGSRWLVKGEGYFYADATYTSGSEAFYASSSAKACIAKRWPAVDLTLFQWQYGPDYPGTVACNIYASQQTSGHFSFAQSSGLITATFTTPMGSFSQTITAPTPMQFLGTNVRAWNGDWQETRSNPLWNPELGFDTGTIPMASPDSGASVSCTVRMPAP